jgi:hypothetical protein
MLLSVNSDFYPNFVTLQQQHNIGYFKKRNAINSDINRFPCRFDVGKKLSALPEQCLKIRAQK